MSLEGDPELSREAVEERRMDDLTPEERQLLGGLVLACHEELMKGIPPKGEEIQCNKCKKHIPFTATCEVYPKWIPDEVLDRKDGCPDFEAK